MRGVKPFFYVFIGLCVLVSLMVLQVLIIQSSESTNTSAETTPSRGKLKSFLVYMRYLLYLPRTKILLFVKNLRSAFKKKGKSTSLSKDKEVNYVDMFAEMMARPDYVQYLVFIISAPNKRANRDVLRTKSYMAYDWRDEETGEPVDWKHYFVVGQSEDENVNTAVKEEALTNPDLLIGDFSDSYRNLVFKTLWLIEWASTRYEFEALIKCDDDTIINLSKVRHLMEQHDLTVPFFGGVRFGGMPVFRKGRYEVTKEQWEPDKFAPYCSGGGYVLNKQAIVLLLAAHFSHVQPVFLVEDAFIGALAFHAKIDPINLAPSFRAFAPHQWCMNKDAVLMHYVKEPLQIQFIEYYKEHKQFCDDDYYNRYLIEHPKKKKA